MNFMALDIGNIVLVGIFILLIILFFLSFMLFIRRILINQRSETKDSQNINEKLDRIIELLEKDKAKK
ncbi:DUF4083 family protein [Lederbergia ruris]|uniref:DUF4083 family protein n=1 Tax=Lederbergia ruris TaxID=217495 RepID=UPI0039A1C8EA